MDSAGEVVIGGNWRSLPYSNLDQCYFKVLGSNVAKCIKPGFVLDFLITLLRLMRLHPVLYPKSIAREADLHDLVRNGTIDIGFPAYKIRWNSTRDYSTPIIYMIDGYYAKENVFLKSAGEVVIAIGWKSFLVFYCMIFLVATTLCLAVRTTTWRMPSRSHKRSFVGDFVYFLFYLIASLFKQTYHQLKHVPVPITFALLPWFLAAFALSCVYSTFNTTTLVASTSPGFIFSNIKEVIKALVAHDYEAVYYEGGVHMSELCRDKECQDLKTLSSKFHEVPGQSEARAAASEPKRVFFGGENLVSVQHQVSVSNYQTNLLFIADNQLSPVPYAFLINRKRPGLRERFNRAIALSLAGTAKMHDRYEHAKPKYIQHTVNKIVALDFSHFSSFVYFIAKLILLSVVVFLFEVSYHHWAGMQS